MPKIRCFFSICSKNDDTTLKRVWFSKPGTSSPFFTQLNQNLAGFWEVQTVQTSPAELPPSSWVEPIFRAKLESHLGRADLWRIFGGAMRAKQRPNILLPEVQASKITTR